MTIEVVALTLELDSINRRSLGARVMRIRRVDARTGGRIGIRSALISNLARRACAAALAPLAQQEAMMRFYREHEVNPLGACLPSMVIGLIAPWAPALLSPRRQNIPHRLAGIVWIVEDRKS